uniref:Uncharacterized protein n=2 Tax=Octopus bimaculoides TaxID=37653 RepID=A0A0L8FW12_OCTBM|eukprot:XP_014786360.1 PREDICTED: poly [ADP-ribose] polymerase 14-like [Octopus bimaculoides]
MYFYFDYQNCQANILGFNKSNVIKMKNRLLDHFRRICEYDLNIHERRILSGHRFFEQAQRQSEDLQVRIHGDKVIFEGQSSEITNCQKDMNKILQAVVKSKLCLPLNAGMIINKKPVKEYLDEKLRGKKCIGSWEPGNGDSVLLYASDKRHLSDLEKVMKQSFVANTLDFVDKIKGTPNHGKWLTFVESLKKEFPNSHFIGEDSIVAVDAIINDIKSKIDNFEQSLTYESYISMPLEHFLFLKEFKEQEINDFGEKNKMKNVCLKDNKLHVEGTQKKIRKMETFIGNLRKDISSKEVNFEMFGFQEFLESEAGKNFLCEMQNESESIISLNSDLGSETEEILNFKYKNCEIVLREGDITTLDTDAIVNAANGRLEHMRAAIVQKGGIGIQAESNEIMKQRRIELKPGEVVSTKAGKLKCKTIIHVVGPVWNNGRNHEIFHLSRAVQNCLAFLEEKSYTSIAIPAISTGIFGIPIEEGTKCTVMAIKYHLDIHSNSKIKHICLIDVRKEVIRAFKHHLEKVFGISERRDDEFEEIEDNVSGGQQDVGFTLKFFTKYKNLDNAIETVKEVYHSLLTTEKIPFDMDLTESRKLSLRNISRTYKIQISIRDTITIFGRRCHVKDAKLSVRSLLMEFKKSDEETLIKEMVQWSYFDENNPSYLQMFSDKENAKLEKAYSQKKQFLNWKKIKYDFQKMSFQHEGRKFQMKRKQNLKDELIPDTWSPMGDEELMKIVPVTNGPEYDDIQATFRRNSPSSRIISIERIQNKPLYQRYQALKKQFEAENPKVKIEVDGLWHGTAAESVKRINKYGFNYRYCHKNGKYIFSKWQQ